ncbi:hypothetical protein DFQ26_000838 [Actinomortierella ambigua]|nr:hypothetical protein DFQ26_000838 [Actinomortierella ambigua]
MVISYELFVAKFTGRFAFRSDRIPRYYEQMPKVSPMALVFRILSSLEFSDRSFDCPFEVHGSPSDPFRCHQYQGNNILEHNGLIPPDYFPGPIAYLLIHWVIFLALTWIMLTWNVVAPSSPQNPGNIIDLIIGLTRGLFVGYDPHVQRPQSLQQISQVRSSVTVDQLRHIIVSAANKVTPPGQLVLLEEEDRVRDLSSSSAGIRATAAASLATIQTTVTKRSTMATETTNTTSTTTMCDPSPFPTTPKSEQFDLERASSPLSLPPAAATAAAPGRADVAETLNDLCDDNGEGVGAYRLDMWEHRRNDDRDHNRNCNGDNDDKDHHHEHHDVTEDEEDDEDEAGERGAAGWAPLPVPRDLIEIRIDRLGLYATAPLWLANTDGSRWKPWVRRKERQRILHDLSVTFPPGQVTGIVGGRGTGKTALLEVILNRLSPSSSSSSSSSAASSSSLASAFCINLPTMSATTLTIHGDVYFNGSRNPCLAKLDAVCGYVGKDTSFLLTHLTVRETLRYAVELHLSSRRNRHRQRSSRHRQHYRSTMSQVGQPPQSSRPTQSFKTDQQNDCEDRVEALLDLVALQDCADMHVGSGRCDPHGPSPGCSESQRRRLTIALQLINEPTCLVLDEPTTGLEAVEALEVMSILKTLARMGGRTVIVALHKPWATVWNELDNVVLLMHGGRLGYTGKISGILHFFAAAHLVLPAHTNPADFVVEKTLINYKTPQDEVETRQRIEQLAQFFAEYRLHMPSPYYREDDDISSSNGITSNRDRPSNDNDGIFPQPTNGRSFPRARTARKLRRRTPRYSSFLRATPILTRRSFVNAWRQKGLFLNRILAPCMACLMIDLYFTHIDRSPAGMLERFSFIQIQVLMSWYGAFVAENRFSVEKGIAYHEISNGVYGPSSFLLAYTINELPVTIIASALSLLFTYVAVPFNWTWEGASLLFGTTAILIMTGESLRMLFSTWIHHSVGVSLSVTVIVITMLNQMAGFLKHRLPRWLVKANYLNLWRYTTEALARGIFPGVEVECTGQQELELRCLIRDGESWMAFLRLNRFSVAECMVGMLTLSVFYRILVWVSLLIKTSRQRG